MLHLLRRHPFAVRAHFRNVLVLAYAYPSELLKPLLPPGLMLDTYCPSGTVTSGGAEINAGEVGFLAIAMVQTEKLRPVFLPEWLGQDFFLSGYRIFARFTDHNGRTRRGLRILRSDTDRSLMKWAGNLLTHYNYCKASVRLRETTSSLEMQIGTGGVADLEVAADLSRTEAGLPPGSPFATLQDARRFAGPLPYTFDYEKETHSIVIIKGVRASWKPRLVPVEVRRLTFVESPPFSEVDPVLASAFHVASIDYRWERGIREPLPAE